MNPALPGGVLWSNTRNLLLAPEVGAEAYSELLTRGFVRRGRFSPRSAGTRARGTGALRGREGTWRPLLEVLANAGEAPTHVTATRPPSKAPVMGIQGRLLSGAVCRHS